MPTRQCVLAIGKVAALYLFREFEERAQAARPGFTVTASTAPAVAAICAQLDGLPLAIELAAARMAVPPPEALLPRLSSRLKVLTGGARDMEERQQTMRAAIAWSKQLLRPEEQRLFRRLAVLVGGCTLEAAEAVCAAPEGAVPLGSDLLDGLGTLVASSVVTQREEGGDARFGMVQVIREYALERLETAESPGADAEAEALCRAHAAYFVGLACSFQRCGFTPTANSHKSSGISPKAATIAMTG